MKFIFLVNCPSEPDTQTTRTGLTSLPRTDKCTGSLVLKHSNYDSLGNYRKIILSQKDEYLNVRKVFPVLKKHIIHGLNAEGTCCWELFSRPKHRGKKVQTIWPGEVYLPEFQVISAKRNICKE